LICGPSSLVVRRFASLKQRRAELSADAHSAHDVESGSHTCDDLFNARRDPRKHGKTALPGARHQKNREKSRKIGRNTLFDLDEWLLFIE
jgi:hypothetical protein